MFSTDLSCHSLGTGGGTMLPSWQTEVVLDYKCSLIVWLQLFLHKLYIFHLDFQRLDIFWSENPQIDVSGAPTSCLCLCGGEALLNASHWLLL